MSLVKVQGNVSGTGVFTVAAPNSNTDRTLTLPDNTGTVVSTGDTATVTPTMLSQKLTSGTAVSASGTSVNFTGIPAWAKKITVMFSGVSTNGTSGLQVQIGSGSVTTSGYSSTNGYITNGGPGSAGGGTASTGFTIAGVAATTNSYGMMTITNVTGNTWCANHVIGNSANTMLGGGTITLSGILDRVRITTTNGTDTFDAGTINIMYEG